MGQTRSVAWGDLDQDGSLDLIVANEDAPDLVLLNDGQCRFLRVLVRGAGAGAAAADGIGTRVILREASCGDIVGTREVNGGEGYASHDLTPLHFGLLAASGGADGGYELVVRFADGEVRTLQLIPSAQQAVVGGVTLHHTVEIAQ